MFLEDVTSLPLKREVEFSIDLVIGTEAVSVVAYRLSPTEMGESKMQLEDLLEKKKSFVLVCLLEVLPSR